MTRFPSVIIASLILTVSIMAQDVKVKKTPSIELKDLNGKSLKLSEYKGKIVMLNFWATWCVPCAAEVPDLVNWQDQYKAEGLQIIGITYPPTSTVKVRRFVRKNKINYPILFGSIATKKLFEPSSTLPVTIIIDRDGNIVDRIDGVIFIDEFETKIKQLLKSNLK